MKERNSNERERYSTFQPKKTSDEKQKLMFMYNKNVRFSINNHYTHTAQKLSILFLAQTKTKNYNIKP